MQESCHESGTNFLDFYLDSVILGKNDKIGTTILHNDSAPAMISYSNGNVLVEFYYFNGLLQIMSYILKTV